MDDDVAFPFASTAYWIAAVRARETARPDRLFDDPWATALAGDLGTEVLARAERAAGGENPYLPVRTRFIDDVLVSGASGCLQIVLLGAGFDTRAFRLAVAEGVRWFEIDRAEIFERKETILARAAARPRRLRIIVQADLASDWPARLLAQGFDPAAPTAWVAEGLFVYLADQSVESLLIRTRRISAVGSLLVADLFGSGIMTSPGMSSYVASVTRRGLPPPFWTDRPDGLFRQHGWDRVEIVEPGDVRANFDRLPGPGRRPSNVSATRSWLIVAHADGIAAP
jgi:methyltransferase (TIGR00027 family)